MPNRPCKVLTQLMVSLVVCLGLTAQAQGTVVMSLVPSAPPLAAIGDTISFNLSITGATDLYAFQFSLMFDPTVVTLASLVEGAALGTAGTTFFVPGAFDNISGLLELTGDSLIAIVQHVV